jgi:hypothetical protein
MTQPEFEKYIWSGMERVRCPAPCHFNYETEAEARACYEVCPSHPKPQKRVSEIVGPNGEDIVVVEEPEPPIVVAVRKRSKPLHDLEDADATGEP